MIRSQSRFKASLNISCSPNPSAINVNQESPAQGHHDSAQESDGDCDVDVVSQHSPASSTPISSRVLGVGVRLPNQNTVVFNWGDTLTTSTELRNSVDVCDAAALRSGNSTVVPNPSDKVLTSPPFVGNSCLSGNTRQEVGRTPLPCGSRLPLSNFQTTGVATVSQEVGTSRTLALSRSVQRCELSDSNLTRSTCPVRTVVSTPRQSPGHQGSGASPSPVVTAASAALQPTR